MIVLDIALILYQLYFYIISLTYLVINADNCKRILIVESLKIMYYCDKVTPTNNFFYINEKSLRISMNDHSNFTRISFHFNYYLSIRYIHTSIYRYMLSLFCMFQNGKHASKRVSQTIVTHLRTELNEPLEFISVILFIYLFFNSVR